MRPALTSQNRQAEIFKLHWLSSLFIVCHSTYSVEADRPLITVERRMRLVNMSTRITGVFFSAPSKGFHSFHPNAVSPVILCNAILICGSMKQSNELVCLGQPSRKTYPQSATTRSGFPEKAPYGLVTCERQPAIRNATSCDTAHIIYKMRPRGFRGGIWAN